MRFRLSVARNIHTIAFLPILLSSYCCSVNPWIVCVLFLVAITNLGGCSFYIVFESLYRYIKAVFNAGELSSPSWFSGLFSEVLPLFPLWMVPNILQGEESPGVYPFIYNLVSSSFLVLPRYSFCSEWKRRLRNMIVTCWFVVMNLKSYSISLGNGK